MINDSVKEVEVGHSKWVAKMDSHSFDLWKLVGREVGQELLLKVGFFLTLASDHNPHTQFMYLDTQEKEDGTSAEVLLGLIINKTGDEVQEGMVEVKKFNFIRGVMRFPGSKMVMELTEGQKNVCYAFVCEYMCVNFIWNSLRDRLRKEVTSSDGKEQMDALDICLAECVDCAKKCKRFFFKGD